MRLYLVQHGEAVPKAQDPDRPLTEGGRAEVQRLAHFMRAAGVRIERVRHSGKTRAAQTAEILVAALSPGAKLESSGGMGPDDDPGPLVAQAAHWPDSLVVGHLPFLAKAVSLLLCGDTERTAVWFRPGTLAVLERDGAGPWGLVLMVRPEFLAG